MQQLLKITSAKKLKLRNTRVGSGAGKNIPKKIFRELFSAFSRNSSFPFISLSTVKADLNELLFPVKNLFYGSAVIKQNEELKKAGRQYAEKNKEISDSMTYAKEIQNVFLPKQSYIQQHFSDSFIIHLPKQIISGDFYWFNECDGKLIIAMGDCTGHGVPAALISVMAVNNLNHITNDRGITNPSQILKHLNAAIHRTCSSQNMQAMVSDGMDIAICTIDKKNNLLEFAGANRPLFCVNNSSATEIIAGDKKCIGGDDAVKEFTGHKILLDTVNGICMFSDGFSDQFGGPRGKKFLSRHFMNLLSSVCNLSMSQQKEILLDILGKWKGELEQTDDISVLGIKF